MTRREFLLTGSALLATVSGGAWAESALATGPGFAPVPFNHEWLIEEAGRLAAAEFVPPKEELPPGLADLGYDGYRDIRFRSNRRIWAGTPSRFQLELLHRGFIFRTPVSVAIVTEQGAEPIAFTPDLFDYGPSAPQPTPGAALDFSGFRARHPINTPDIFDEFLVFQGASYFRAVARDQVYGISARALAVNTAEPGGEEFPAFRRFWIARPAPEATALTVHALLDSPSVTGAYRVVATPGAETAIEVDATIFPRTEIAKIGIAPLTSMFLFNGTNQAGFDDFRRAVHDSDGLQLLTGAGEWLWRPLLNPASLQISGFSDTAPRGFGLMQRARRYEDFLDIEARYEKRPSLWIEPLGDWGRGAVELVEIPTETEFNDNIVAYWRPADPVVPGRPLRFAYRMRWTDRVLPQAGTLVTAASRMGLAQNGERRLFVIDFAADPNIRPDALQLDVNASTGRIDNAVIHAERPDGAVRTSFELAPEADQVSELRLRLLAEGRPVSETWLYRWAPR